MVVDQVGFRTIETDGTRILVNGEVTFLRGISMHAEAMSGGRRSHGPPTPPRCSMRRKRLGVNFVRLAHYQHDEHMVREADRRGILAWCELPVYWGIAFDQPHVLDNAREQLDELVTRDRSRASVIFWSVANETMPSPERTAFLTTLADRARELDPTRLVSAALLTLPTDAQEHHVDDPLGAVVDVVAINQYLGWYYGRRETIADDPLVDTVRQADRVHRDGRRSESRASTATTARSGPKSSRRRCTPHTSRWSKRTVPTPTGERSPACRRGS